MGKKQNSLQIQIQHSILKGSELLNSNRIKRISKPVRQFLWQQAKNNNISFRTQNLLNQTITKALGQEKVQGQFDQLFKKSEETYEMCSQLFKIRSLKERCRRLLGQQNEEEETQERDQNLSDQETEWLEKVKRVYRKYRVSSMYRKNVVKQLKRYKVDALIRKGYLRQSQPEILTLVS